MRSSCVYRSLCARPNWSSFVYKVSQILVFNSNTTTTDDAKKSNNKGLFTRNGIRSVTDIRTEIILYLPSATKLRQGNVFTPVCHSVHRGVCHTSSGQTPLGRHPLLRSACWDTVNKQAVRILLECNFVENIISIKWVCHPFSPKNREKLRVSIFSNTK